MVLITIGGPPHSVQTLQANTSPNPYPGDLMIREMAIVVRKVSDQATWTGIVFDARTILLHSSR